LLVFDEPKKSQQLVTSTTMTATARGASSRCSTRLTRTLEPKRGDQAFKPCHCCIWDTKLAYHYEPVPQTFLHTAYSETPARA